MRQWLAVPRLCADKLGGKSGDPEKLHNSGFQCRKRKPLPVAVKPVGVVVVGETPSLTRDVVGETHRVLECTQTHLPKSQYQKGPICLWVVEEVTESRSRARQVALFPL